MEPYVSDTVSPAPYARQLIARIKRSLAAKEALLSDHAALSAFEAATREVVAAYRAGGRLYIAGNGGSAADAQHLATEFVSKLAHDRNPLPAEALTVDGSILTAIGNDYGFDHVFSRQLQAKAQAPDLFLGVSTSGNSANIVEALQTCRTRGIRSILFTGFAGGRCAALVDWCVIAPGGETAVIQELHIVLAHALCASVAYELFFAAE